MVAWVVLTGAGFRGLALLALFVVSGSVLVQTSSGKRQTGNGGSEPGRFPFRVSRFPPRRRAIQVLANGWTAALGSALVPLSPELGWALLAGGLATAQADTWATEIGLRSPRPPTLLTTGGAVARGTSGATTPTGTAAGLAGATVLGGAAAALTRDLRLGLVASACGTAGMLVDSLLGATAQAAYRCAVCHAPSERARHCGAPARLVGGHRWVSNDLVNAVATGAGAALAAAAVAIR
jgi:uncharacterized protein (TIGR00297 family)